MKRHIVSVLVLAGLALAGCGGGGGGGSYASGSLGLGCLDVHHEADSAAPRLVAVLLHDPDTHALLRQEIVNLPPGEEVDLMDIPAGTYEVVGVFHDGYRSPVFPAPPLIVEISPDLEAEASFRR